MNHFEAMKALLIQKGYEEKPEPEYGWYGISGKQFYIGSPGTKGNKGASFDYAFTIVLGEGIGYGGFCCIFFYDAEGKAITHGCWE